MKKIISIDPGINNSGLTVLEKQENSYIIYETVLIKNNKKFTEKEKEIEIKYNSKTVKVLSILNGINKLINKYKDIEAIVIEAPFYNSLTPMTFGSILEIIFSIKYTINLKLDLPLYLIEPLLIKKLFTNNRLSNKECMKQYLKLKIENKEIILNKSLEELSEHEIDSIAIGYIFFLTRN